MRPRLSPKKTSTPISRKQSPTYYGGRGFNSAKSPFQKKIKKTPNRWLVKSIDYTLLAALLAVLIYSLVVSASPAVKATTLNYHSAQDYARAAAIKIKALSNRNKITFNENSVTDALRAQFPEISSATIELPIFSQTPVVRLNISPPNLYLSSQGVNYIVDGDGRAIAKASDYPSIKNLPQLTDASSFQVEKGKQVLSSEAINFINTILAQSKHAGVPVKDLVLPRSAQEVDLTTKDQSYFVKFYLGGDPLTQSGQFLAARQQFASKNIHPTEYLDVRVAGKVFYK